MVGRIMRWKKWAIGAVAGLTVGAYITDAKLDAIMADMVPKVQERLALQIETLQAYIDAGSLELHPGYTEWIDAAEGGIDYNQAQAFADGLSAILAASDGYEYGVTCSTSMDEKFGADTGYGWVYKSGYPYIGFCRIIEASFSGEWGDGVLVHEGSHFYPPHGMGSSDATYLDEVSREYARTDPVLAASVAHNIEKFYTAEIPPPPPDPEAFQKILPALLYLLE